MCAVLFPDLDQPRFNSSWQSTMSIVESRYFSIICNATSNPKADYRWTDSSGQIISNTRTLVFLTIQRSDAKLYTCIANNSAGLEKRSSLMIDVQCKLNFSRITFEFS